MYTEYQIRASVIKVLKQALSETETTGYVVMARNQQKMTNEEDVVLLDKLNTQRIGWQGRDYYTIEKEDESLELHKFEEWIERITFQVSVVHKRKVTDTIDSLTGEDVVKRLQMWLNSAHGASVMREMTPAPFAPFLISQTRSQPYTDESDIHQVDEQFDFGICVPQRWDEKQVDISDWEIETHPI